LLFGFESQRSRNSTSRLQKMILLSEGTQELGGMWQGIVFSRKDCSCEKEESRGTSSQEILRNADG
jgi:hypothetical protein